MLATPAANLLEYLLSMDDVSLERTPFPASAPADDASGIILSDDGERVLRRERRRNSDGRFYDVLIATPSAKRAASAALDRLTHEYDLRDELNAAWAARPIELVREHGHTVLVLQDPGGEPPDRLHGEPMELGSFQRLAIAVTDKLTSLHRSGLIHKDLKPANILVTGSGDVRFTGFGIASRQARGRQRMAPPETIAGSLAYMAPEQTGRVNRSVDSRSDLYALGVTFYRMITGALPFKAADAAEWMHCHVARRPMPASSRRKGVPNPVSDIVMKLLAKTPAERYQTAAGLKCDLEHCLSAWEARGRIDDFDLGQADAPDGLRIPEKLYGRQREVESLRASLENISSSRRPSLVLISGHAGVGKSTLVQEFRAASVAIGGFFTSGKFDQHERDIPYTVVAQAFRGLVRHVLAMSEADLIVWRDAIREALDPLGGLLVDLVPELGLIIGKQAAVYDASPRDARRRFRNVVRRFIGVFATKDRPLTLFLDDLQWSDAATLDVLEDLLLRSELPNLLLVGAYRDNEVYAAHPLVRCLARFGDADVRRIELTSLSLDGVTDLTADALRCEPARATPLARMLHEKTGGNPFFLLQFLQALAQEELLVFDHGEAQWRWDIRSIQTKGYTDNVADLMVARLKGLGDGPRSALAALACLGDGAETATLEVVLGAPTEKVHADLRLPLRMELIERRGGFYRFVHDRVREAAYALIPDALRPAEHLKIGRRLLAETPVALRERRIFEIVGQLDRGAPLIDSNEERAGLAELDLIAGRRAKTSAAYDAALGYFVAGSALLTEDGWLRQHTLAFALELNRAECEFLTGDLSAAEARLAALASRPANTVERAAVACIRIDVYTTLDRSVDAVTIGLEFLAHLGVRWPPKPTKEDAREEYCRVLSQLGDRRIEELIDAPLMTDVASLATMDVLTKLLPPALFTDMNLLSLLVSRAVNLGLEQGNSDGSCVAYVQLGMIAGIMFDDHKIGFRFGDLGYRLVEHHGLTRFRAATYMLFGAHVLPWTRHVREASEVLRRAFDIANRNGDLTFAGYSRSNLNGNRLEAGDPLPDVQRDIDEGLAVALKLRFGFVADIIAAQRGLVRTLRGLTPKFGSFDDNDFDERGIERRFDANPNLWRAELMYWNLKLRALVFAGDYAAAVAALAKWRSRPWIPLTPREASSYHFFAAMSLAGLSRAAPAEPQHLAHLGEHHRKLLAWAGNGPENFADRAALVGAEIARLEGRDADAMRLYEDAICSAGVNDFAHMEALAYETAASFYAARGFEEFARLYLQNARDGYLRWGAHGKVRQLERRHPHLQSLEQQGGRPGTIGAPVEQLDLKTVLEVSQAVSGEIIMEKLVDTLMRKALEHAGARRGLLLVPDGAELKIRAEATTGETIEVELRDAPIAGADLPKSLVLYASRTREPIALDDASARGAFVDDEYVRRKRARSVLCLPLVKQGDTVAVLYLENDLVADLFTPDRVAILRFLAAEAATSLDTARLYRAVEEREARIRRLVDANIIGIAIFGPDGRIIDANNSFLRQIGYDREHLDAGKLRWTELTPPEWRDRSALAHEELRATGAFQPFEKEYIHKDGSRVPILVGAAAFDETHAVAFVLDLSERKRAEARARENERRYLEVQTELAHANRVAAAGQLTASIAHEVNQPLTAMVTNAQAALRFLGREQPDLGEVGDALSSISQDGIRAGEVIARIRNLVRKKPPNYERLTINEVIREVIELTHAEAARKRVMVQTDFADGLPEIMGDRVELQQVAVNLILNAIEAMSGSASAVKDLSVHTARGDDGGVCVTVADTGPGLPPDGLARLLQPFYTTKPSGLGIGLSICRSIVEAHGGRLQATANIPQGAIFRFAVPAADAGSSRRTLK
jgi:PAS domain S-box-containing protein